MKMKTQKSIALKQKFKKLMSTLLSIVKREISNRKVDKIL